MQLICYYDWIIKYKGCFGSKIACHGFISFDVDVNPINTDSTVYGSASKVKQKCHTKHVFLMGIYTMVTI